MGPTCLLYLRRDISNHNLVLPGSPGPYPVTPSVRPANHNNNCCMVHTEADRIKYSSRIREQPFTTGGGRKIENLGGGEGNLFSDNNCQHFFTAKYRVFCKHE